MCAIGLCLFIPFPTLDQPAFAPMREWGNDIFWGSLLVTLSTIRAIALWRNGAWTPSPIIRAITAAISTGIWALFALGLYEAYVLLPIFIGFVFADTYSVGRAATDARLTRDERLNQPEAPKVLSVV